MSIDETLHQEILELLALRIPTIEVEVLDEVAQKIVAIVRDRLEFVVD